jgi:hypothetical protein
MAVTSTTGASAVDQLAQSLMDRFDANKDGTLSRDEFSGLMGQLLGAVGNGSPRAQSSPWLMAESGSAVKFEGFNFSREQKPQESAKDAFAMIAREVGSMPLTKPEAETWFNNHVRGRFEGLGHKVNWVAGDKFSFTNWQGTFTVDFVRGADGPDPALWWGVE